jgi:hypothetical protein
MPFTDISCSSHIMILATTQDVGSYYKYCHNVVIQEIFLWHSLIPPIGWEPSILDMEDLEWQKLQDYGHYTVDKELLTH